MTQPNDALVAACKPGLRGVCAFMNMTLSSMARIQAKQLEAVNGMLAETASVARQMESAQRIEDLVEIQTRLVRGFVERGMASMSAAYQAAAELQSEALMQAQEEISRTAAGPSGAAPAEAASPLAMWQSMMQSASGAYAASLKVTEDLTRMAAERAGKAAAWHPADTVP